MQTRWHTHDIVCDECFFLLFGPAHKKEPFLLLFIFRFFLSKIRGNFCLTGTPLILDASLSDRIRQRAKPRVSAPF